MKLKACCVAAWLAAFGAHAETVYRCGTDGNRFSSTPCDGGRVIEVDDSRTIAQRQEALAAARRDARLADRLAQERRTQEAVSAKGPANLGPAATPPAAAASQPKKKKKHRSGDEQPTGLTPPIRVPAR